MRLHERTLLVREAGNEMRSVLDDIIKKHDLSSIEFLQILNEVAATELKYMLREERHPEDPDKPADQA